MEGGANVTVSPAVCFYGIGTLRFARAAEKINRKSYADVLTNKYSAVCQEFGEPGGTYIFMQDGAGTIKPRIILVFCPCTAFFTEEG